MPSRVGPTFSFCPPTRSSSRQNHRYLAAFRLETDSDGVGMEEQSNKKKTFLMETVLHSLFCCCDNNCHGRDEILVKLFKQFPLLINCCRRRRCRRMRRPSVAEVESLFCVLVESISYSATNSPAVCPDNGTSHSGSYCHNDQLTFRVSTVQLSSLEFIHSFFPKTIIPSNCLCK